MEGTPRLVLHSCPSTPYRFLDKLPLALITKSAPGCFRVVMNIKRRKDWIYWFKGSASAQLDVLHCEILDPFPPRTQSHRHNNWFHSDYLQSVLVNPCQSLSRLCHRNDFQLSFPQDVGGMGPASLLEQSTGDDSGPQAERPTSFGAFTSTAGRSTISPSACRALTNVTGTYSGLPATHGVSTPHSKRHKVEAAAAGLSQSLLSYDECDWKQGATRRPPMRRSPLVPTTWLPSASTPFFL